MSEQVLAALVGGLVALVAALVAPLLVARLPEPDPDPEPDPEPGPAPQPERRPGPVAVPSTAGAGAPPPFTAWGLRPDDGTKESYAEMARLPALRVWSPLAAGVVGALVGWHLGLSRDLVVVLPVVPVGVVLAVVDWRSRLLPTRLVLPATLLVLLLGAATWLLGDAGAGAGADLVRGLIGLALTRSVFWLMWFVHRVGMGFGDVRLSALLGFALAHVGWSELLVGMYAGFLVFSVPGVGLALVRRDRRMLKVAFPYGPFMLAGGLLGLLVGGAVGGLAS